MGSKNKMSKSTRTIDGKRLEIFLMESMCKFKILGIYVDGKCAKEEACCSHELRKFEIISSLICLFLPHNVPKRTKDIQLLYEDTTLPMQSI